MSSTPPASVLPLTISALTGFFLGLLEALDRLSRGPTLHLAEAGIAIAGLAGLASIADRRGRIAERILLTLLRAGLSVGVFACTFEGMRELAKIGHIGSAVAAFVGAGVFGLLLAHVAPHAEYRGRADTSDLQHKRLAATAASRRMRARMRGPRLKRRTDTSQVSARPDSRTAARRAHRR